MKKKKCFIWSISASLRLLQFRKYDCYYRVFTFHNAGDGGYKTIILPVVLYGFLFLLISVRHCGHTGMLDGSVRPRVVPQNSSLTHMLFLSLYSATGMNELPCSAATQLSGILAKLTLLQLPCVGSYDLV